MSPAVVLAERDPIARAQTAAILDRQDEIAAERISELAHAIVAQLADALKG
jgi:hypothetical protein